MAEDQQSVTDATSMSKRFDQLVQVTASIVNLTNTQINNYRLSCTTNFQESHVLLWEQQITELWPSKSNNKLHNIAF